MFTDTQFQVNKNECHVTSIINFKFILNMWMMRWGCKRQGGFKECDPVGGLVTGQVESCDGSGPGIIIGDPTADISY